MAKTVPREKNKEKQCVVYFWRCAEGVAGRVKFIKQSNDFIEFANAIKVRDNALRQGLTRVLKRLAPRLQRFIAELTGRRRRGGSDATNVCDGASQPALSFSSR
jgi:hypothetical protein